MSELINPKAMLFSTTNVKAMLADLKKETCPADGGDHDWRDERERYGEDADGNRGTWQHFKRCTKCGDER